MPNDPVSTKAGQLHPTTVPTCPFMGGPCSKLKGKKSYHPVCSVRTTNGQVFVVCQDRLIPAKTRLLTSFHITALASISQFLFPGINDDDIGYRKQVGVTIGVSKKNRVTLDYVLSIRDGVPFDAGPRQVILEVQGGGETSNTGTISRQVEEWMQQQPRSNAFLRRNVSNVNPIPNNAWKRQLEQGLRKATLAAEFGGAVALVMGDYLYQYVRGSVGVGGPFKQDWQFALINIKEEALRGPGPIPLDVVSQVDFMTFAEFVMAIRKYPLPPDLRNPSYGRYASLTNKGFVVS